MLNNEDLAIGELPCVLRVLSLNTIHLPELIFGFPEGVMGKDIRLSWEETTTNSVYHFQIQARHDMSIDFLAIDLDVFRFGEEGLHIQFLTKLSRPLATGKGKSPKNLRLSNKDFLTHENKHSWLMANRYGYSTFFSFDVCLTLPH